ncbi:hypothetical protein OROGR_015044 [Orobanche gracilis]
MRYFWTLAQESPLIKKYKTLQEATAEFNRMLREGTLPKQVYIKSMLRSGNKPTHPDDWMLAFDRSAEGRALYRDREDDSFINWWRGTKNDPSWKKH